MKLKKKIKKYVFDKHYLKDRPDLIFQYWEVFSLKEGIKIKYIVKTKNYETLYPIFNTVAKGKLSLLEILEL